MRTLQAILSIFGLTFTLVVSAAEIKPLPRDLEIELALSSLPPHLRPDATVYTLNPATGFEVAREGRNGFHAFVARTMVPSPIRTLSMAWVQKKRPLSIKNTRPCSKNCAK